ncbi:unnamed protein product [Mucor hiemalis]
MVLAVDNNGKPDESNIDNVVKDTVEEDIADNEMEESTTDNAVEDDDAVVNDDITDNKDVSKNTITKKQWMMMTIGQNDFFCKVILIIK